MWLAASNGHMETVQVLLGAGPDATLHPYHNLPRDDIKEAIKVGDS